MGAHFSSIWWKCPFALTIIATPIHRHLCHRSSLLPPRAMSPAEHPPPPLFLVPPSPSSYLVAHPFLTPHATWLRCRLSSLPSRAHPCPQWCWHHWHPHAMRVVQPTQWTAIAPSLSNVTFAASSLPPQLAPSSHTSTLRTCSHCNKERQVVGRGGEGKGRMRRRQWAAKVMTIEGKGYFH